MQPDKRKLLIGQVAVVSLLAMAFFCNSQLHRPMRQLDQTVYATMLFKSKQYTRIDTSSLDDNTAELLLRSYPEQSKVKALLAKYPPKEALHKLIEGEVAK